MDRKQQKARSRSVRVCGLVLNPVVRSGLLRRTGHSPQRALRMVMVESVMMQLNVHYSLRYRPGCAVSNVGMER